MAIKRGSRLTTKVLKSFGPNEVAHAAVRKHADHDQFFCGSDDHVLFYPEQKTVQFILVSNNEFTVKLYKEEIGKPYSKIDLFLCDGSNVDDAVDRKVGRKTKKLAWKGVVLGHHQSLNLQILSLTIKNKMPIMMKTHLQLSFPLSCFHLHHYKKQKIYSCHLYRYKAQIIYKASYNLRQDIKKNPPVAEIFSVQVMDVKFFAQFVITPLA